MHYTGDLEDIQGETKTFQIKIVFTSALLIIFLQWEIKIKLHLIRQRML